MKPLQKILTLALLTLTPSHTLAEVKSGPAPALKPGGKWFNTKPRTLKQLKGKVVLVNLWVYCCINCHTKSV